MFGGGSEEIPITPLEKELTAIAAERYKRYEDVFIPIEDKAIADVLDTTDERKQARGLANVDSAIAFSKAQAGTERASALTKGLGQGTALDMESFGRAREDSISKGLSQAESLTESARLGNIMALTQRGMNQGNQGLQGLGEAAEASQARAIADVEAEIAARNAMRQLAGTAAGLGMQSYMGQTPGLAKAQSQWATMTNNPQYSEVGSTGLQQGWADGFFSQ